MKIDVSTVIHNETRQMVGCCYVKLCEPCYIEFLEKTHCPYCHELILQQQIRNCCNSLCSKRVLYSILIFSIWYIVNFISLYLLQYYIYHIKIDVGMFLVLLLMSLNSSFAIIMIMIALISCSVSLTESFVNRINGNRGDGYISYDDL